MSAASKWASLFRQDSAAPMLAPQRAEVIFGEGSSEEGADRLAEIEVKPAPPPVPKSLLVRAKEQLSNIFTAEQAPASTGLVFAAVLEGRPDAIESLTGETYRPGAFRYFGPPLTELLVLTNKVLLRPVPLEANTPNAPARFQAALNETRSQFEPAPAYAARADVAVVNAIVRAQIDAARKHLGPCGPLRETCPRCVAIHAIAGTPAALRSPNGAEFIGPILAETPHLATVDVDEFLDGAKIYASSNDADAAVESAKAARENARRAAEEQAAHAAELERLRTTPRPVLPLDLGVIVLTAEIPLGRDLPVAAFVREGQGKRTAYVLVQGYPFPVPTGQVTLDDGAGPITYSVLPIDIPIEISPEEERRTRRATCRELQAFDALRKVTIVCKPPTSWIDARHPEFPWHREGLLGTVRWLIAQADAAPLESTRLLGYATVAAALGFGDKETGSPIAPDLAAAVVHEAAREAHARRKGPSVLDQLLRKYGVNYQAAIESGAKKAEFFIPGDHVHIDTLAQWDDQGFYRTWEHVPSATRRELGAKERLREVDLETFAEWAQAALERRVPCDPMTFDELERKFGVQAFTGWGSDVSELTRMIAAIAERPHVAMGLCELSLPMPASFTPSSLFGTHRDPWYRRCEIARAKGLRCDDGGREFITNEEIGKLLLAAGEHPTGDLDHPEERRRLAAVMTELGARKQNVQVDGTRRKAWIFSKDGGDE